ncbi:MAG: type II toxin-antitoxin system PemK/MazF family toxin [Promethearchaeota archaeon]
MSFRCFILAEKWRRFKPKFKEIWKADVTYKDSTGHEQKGVRPCLIIKDFEESEIVLIIPFTGNVSIVEYTPYTVKIEPDNQNKLSDNSVAMIYQIKAISKSRLKYKIGRLINAKYSEIEVLLKEIFRF